MSSNLLRSGGLEPPDHTYLTTTSATTVYTAESNNRVIEAVSLANIDASNACIVTLAWVDATPTAHIFWHGEVPAKSTTIVENFPIVNRATGTVRSVQATAANANDIHVTVITSSLARVI